MDEKQSLQASTLAVAIEGLVALDYGEIRPIFSPGDKQGSHDGTRPYTIRKFRMQALGFADFLIANDHKAAIRVVADAYG